MKGESEFLRSKRLKYIDGIQGWGDGGREGVMEGNGEREIEDKERMK